MATVDTKDTRAGVFVDATGLAALRGVVRQRVHSLEQLLETQVDGLWQSLEMLVLYERLHVDGYVLAEWKSARKVADALGEVVVFHTDFSLSYRAADYAIHLVNQMPPLRKLAGCESLPAWFLGEFIGELYSFKEMSEQMVWGGDMANLDKQVELSENRLSRTSISSVMRSSICDAERAIYYYFMARQLGLPYLPNSYRSAIYRALLYAEKPLALRVGNQKEDRHTIEADLMEFINRTVRVPRWEARAAMLPSEYWSVDISPLSAMIFRESARARVTLVDAALAIRARPEAKAFRQFCSSLRKAIQDGRHDRVDKELEELRRVSEEWADIADARPFRRRRITIGSLLNTDIEILDPKIEMPALLKRKKHLIFLHELAVS